MRIRTAAPLARTLRDFINFIKLTDLGPISTVINKILNGMNIIRVNKKNL